MGGARTGWSKNICRIDSDSIIGFRLSITQSPKVAPWGEACPSFITNMI